MRNGVEKGYYENGNIWWEVPWVNGERHGVAKNYRADGSIWREIPLVNGKRHGISKKYHKDGSIELQHYLYGAEVTKEEYRKHELIRGLSRI